MTMNKKIIKSIPTFLLIAYLLFGQSISLKAQDLPDPMSPPRMVKDFAGFLDQRSAGSLEKKLQDFYYSSSTQIYIITVNDLQGYDPSDYATRIGEKWDVGTEGKDNGIVILIKPKTVSSRGEVYMTIGYGLEGAVPDILANRIVNNEILPRFKENDIFGGLNQATDILISFTKGEFTADEYIERASGSKGISIGGIMFLIFLLIAIFGGGSRTGRHSHMGRNLSFLMLLSMMGSGGRSHGGSFGGFSGGGGLGGFGGGGGGSFGGGGAGGSW